MNVQSSAFNPYSSTYNTSLHRPEGTAAPDPEEASKTKSVRGAIVNYTLRELDRANIDSSFTYGAGVSNFTGQLGIGFGTYAHYTGSRRDDWDAISKEKPESFAHVPDKLWEAMMNSYPEGDIMWETCLLDIPKWDFGLHRQPPELRKIEVDDEKMLSYDYLSLLDKKIGSTGITLDNKNLNPETNRKAHERYEKRLVFLHTLRENIAEVLKPPLHTNSDLVSDEMAYERLHNDVGATLLDERFENQTVAYELKFRMKMVDSVMKEKGITEEYKPQLLKSMDEQSHIINEGAREFRNHLLTTNSNLFDHVQATPGTDEAWYTDFLKEQIGRIIDEMGGVDTPEGKWDVPILWELRMAKEAQAAAQAGIDAMNNEASTYEEEIRSQMLTTIMESRGVFEEEEKSKLLETLNNDETLNKSRTDFTDYLVEKRMKAFDKSIVMKDDISETWYKEFLNDRIGKVIENMRS